MKKFFKKNQKYLSLTLLFFCFLFLFVGSSKIENLSANKSNQKELMAGNSYKYVNFNTFSINCSDNADPLTTVNNISGTFTIKNLNDSDAISMYIEFVYDDDSFGYDITDFEKKGEVVNFSKDISNFLKESYEVKIKVTINGDIYYSNIKNVVPNEATSEWLIDDLINLIDVRIGSIYEAYPLSTYSLHTFADKYSDDILYVNMKKNSDEWHADRSISLNNIGEHYFENAIDILPGKYLVFVGEDTPFIYQDASKYSRRSQIMEIDIKPTGSIITDCTNCSISIGEEKALNTHMDESYNGGMAENTHGFKYEIISGSDNISIDNNGNIRGIQEGTAKIKISKDTYGYDNVPAYLKIVDITVEPLVKYVEITEDGYNQKVHPLSETYLKINIPDIDNIEEIDTSKITTNLGEDGSLFKYEIKRDDRCTTSPMFDGCNAELAIYDYINYNLEDVKIENLIFEEGLITYKDGTKSAASNFYDIKITVSPFDKFLEGIEDSTTYETAVTPTSNYDLSDVLITLKKNDGNGNFIDVADYNFGDTISENGEYELEFLSEYAKVRTSWLFGIDIPKIVDIPRDVLYSTVGELAESESFYLSVSDAENIQSFDKTKIRFITDNDADVGVNTSNISISKSNPPTGWPYDPVNYQINFFSFYNNTSEDQTITGIIFEEGFVLYKDGSKNKESVISSGLEITVKKFVEGIKDGEIYSNEVTPTSSYFNDIDYELELTYNGTIVDDYELGTTLKKSGTYSLVIKYPVTKEYIQYDFIIDIPKNITYPEIPNYNTYELSDTFIEVKLNIPNINEVHSFHPENITILDENNKEVNVKNIIGRVTDCGDNCNYILQFQRIYLVNSDVASVVNKIKLKENFVLYNDNTSNDESIIETNIIIDKLIKGVKNNVEYNAPIRPTSDYINEKYTVTLKKDNEIVKDYKLGDQIKENGNYELKVQIVDSAITINFIILNENYIILKENSSYKKKIDSNNNPYYQLPTQNIQISDFRNNFEVLNAKLYTSLADIDDNGVLINATEVTSGIVGTGMKLIPNKSKLEKQDINIIIIKGDLSGDGLIKINDLTKLYKSLFNNNLNEYQKLAGDIKEDNQIKINDITRLYKYLAGTSQSL